MKHSAQTDATTSVSPRLSFYPRSGKRCLDLICAIVGLLLLAPVFLVVAIMVRLSGPGHIWFSQQRTGRLGIPFNMFKFRTMYAPCGLPGPLLTAADDPRITPIGKWLRRTKLDELPQFWNVLRGDMSFVGPRPEVCIYVRLYLEDYALIFSHRPGITGPSINVHEEELLASQSDPEAFYISTILPAKLKVDLDYVQNIRFNRDLALLLSTPSKIFSGLTQLSHNYARAAQNHN